MSDSALSANSGSATAPASPRLLARHPAVGWAMFLTGTIIFALLWWSLGASAVVSWDQSVVQAFHRYATHSSPFVRWLMLTGSWIGQDGLIALSVGLGLYWMWRRRWLETAMLLFGVGGCEAAYQVLGVIVNRHRPVFPDPIEVLKGPGFPSGHTAVGVAFFGLLAYLLWPRLRQTRWRVLLIAGFVALILYITVSRLFQGVHYPTDLIAGYALGLAWSGLIYTLLETAAFRSSRTQA